MSVITDEFEKVCVANSKKKAFYYEAQGKVISKTFAELYTDVKNAEWLLKKNGIGNEKKLLAFASPNYNLLVYMLACFSVGASVMYVDIFAKQDSLKNFFGRFRPDYILVSNKTRLLKPFFKYIRNVKVVNVDKPLEEGEPQILSIDDGTPALITATTGSSGKPKAFIRSHADLFRQLMLIHDNIKIKNQNETILTTSYIYAFANLMQGFTTVLPNINLGLKKKTGNLVEKIKLFKDVEITTVMTSPDFCLKVPNLFPKLKQLYFGGAILNYNEARKIEANYGKADVWYIYGSTECALISGVSLKDYVDVLKKTGKCLLGDICDGVDARINEDGHILVNSKALLRKELECNFKEKYYDTNDIGYLDKGRLYYIGKNGTDVKINGAIYYSNEMEQQIILEFPKLSKCAVIERRGENYVLLEGDVDVDEIRKFVSNKFDIFNVVKINNIPRDPKHHTKIDYARLRRF